VQTSSPPNQAAFPTPWIVAFIEGFSTLAVEVIAIRLAIPVVGSSVTLTGVMLGVVLFALSAGISTRAPESRLPVAALLTLPLNVAPTATPAEIASCWLTLTSVVARLICEGSTSA